MTVNDPNKSNKHITNKTTTPVVVSKEIPKSAVNVDPKGTPTIDPNLKTKEIPNGPAKELPEATPTAAPKMYVDPKAKH